MSKRKKKHKMMNLSDADYGRYISALKDERPTVVIVDDKKDTVD